TFTTIDLSMLLLATRLMAHDEKNECNVGDRVLIMEMRPVSKLKCWRLIKVIEKVK
ncbi:MAG TPA: 30S ribosomal protein S17, partial [Flavobacteriales bacterium]|nr:30S ribosomal protein S17 [Flavobacteriales bacterium]